MGWRRVGTGHSVLSYRNSNSVPKEIRYQLLVLNLNFSIDEFYKNISNQPGFRFFFSMMVY